ncbi:fibroin heavy chain-like [Saccostrea echinata]|uniref:fibroin heavy chain-like n=1 Tax=Saccostrea echinata TaxID=191078 RepID=UPI002A822CCF|nr:fibroin heavy chain-like [Saccostrea echinata]
MQYSKVILCVGFLAVGIHLALAGYGGQTCTIPTSGNPGATTVCTGTANGFCLIDTFTTAGTPSLTSATTTGKCICYYGYSGAACGTVDPTATTTSSTSSSGTGNAIAALGLGLAAAWALSQGLGAGAGAGAGIHLALAAYGGQTCTIPTSGNPGATTVCTGTANGYCLIDTFTTAGSPSLTSATVTGKCICYYGYSGAACGTVDPTASTSSSSPTSKSAANTIATLGLLGAGAWALSQGLSSGGSQNALGLRHALAGYGGQTCTIPTSGNPGATTVCTGTANGFCLIDTFTTAGTPSLNSISTTGRCVCYQGYSGAACGTVDPTTSSTNTNAINAIGALAVGGVGAYVLANGLGSGGSQGPLGIEAGSPQAVQEALYIQQAFGGPGSGLGGLGGVGQQGYGGLGTGVGNSQMAKYYRVLLCLGVLVVGLRQTLAAYGGQSCTIPTSGNPGATTVCTGTANGFCLIDTFEATGSPVTTIATTGKCVCYYGYSGAACGTVDPVSTSSSTTSTSSASNAIAALGLGLAAAWALSQGLGAGASQNALGLGSGSPQSLQEALYIRQALGGAG